MEYILRRYTKEYTIFVQGHYWDEEHLISKQGFSSFKDKSIELLFFKKEEKTLRFNEWYDYECKREYRLTKIQHSIRELARNIPSNNWFFWKKIFESISKTNKDNDKLKMLIEEGQILILSRALGK